MAVATSALDARGLHRRGQLCMLGAVVAWSTAGVLQRALDVDTATQVAGRALFAAIALLIFTAIVERGAVRDAYLRIGRAGLAVALLVAVASGSFIVALNYATVAQVLFIQAAAPIAAALLGRIFLGERIPRRTAAAMAFAIAGVAIMLGAPGGGSALGNVISVVMMLAFAGTVVITRHHREISMTPAIGLSQVIVFVVAFPFSDPASVGGHDLVLLVALGAGQMAVGLALLTMGARLLPAAETALFALLEVVLGPLWVWLAYSEQPGAAVLAGGLVVMVAIALQAFGELRRSAPAADVSR